MIAHLVPEWKNSQLGEEGKYWGIFIGPRLAGLNGRVQRIRPLLDLKKFIPIGLLFCLLAPLLTLKLFLFLGMCHSLSRRPLASRLLNLERLLHPQTCNYFSRHRQCPSAGALWWRKAAYSTCLLACLTTASIKTPSWS